MKKVSILIIVFFIGIWIYTIGYDRGSNVVREIDVGRMVTIAKRKYEKSSMMVDDEFNKIQRALAETASKEYVRDEYNCVNFSEDLVSRLKGRGIYANTVEGRTSEGGHMWVEVWLEATSGHFVGYSNDYIED